MGKKWDGKTLKKKHITHINRRINGIKTGSNLKRYNRGRDIRFHDIEDLWICSVCGKFKHQHCWPSWRHSYSYLCKETYEAIQKIIVKQKEIYADSFLFCETSSLTRTFKRMFIRNDDLSDLIEAYIKLTNKVT
jgi:hypothetical protein